MKPARIELPQNLAQRVSADVAKYLVGVGPTNLLAERLLGLIASRQCPGHVFIETLQRVPQWVTVGHVVVSGFHSPLEQQVLRSLLRREGRAIKVLARGFNYYRPSAEEREPLAEGRLLVLSAMQPDARRTTRESSLKRNHLVLQLASEVYAPYIATGSPLSTLFTQS